MNEPCPWSFFRHAEYVPSCEPNLCAWIVHPAETWSNLAYFIVAAVIVRHYSDGDQKLRVGWLPSMIVFIGVASAAFHGSMTYWLQGLDFASISVFIAYLLSASLLRSRLVGDFRLSFVSFAAAGVLLSFVDPRLGYANLAAQGTAVAVLWFPGLFSASQQRRDLLSAAAALGAGLVALILDFRRVACMHGALAHLLQPHAFWHLFSAVLLFYLYRYERHLELTSAIAV